MRLQQQARIKWGGELPNPGGYTGATGSNGRKGGGTQSPNI